MNISKFTQKSLQAVQNLEKTAYDFGNQEIEQEHLLYNLLHQEDSLILKMIEKMEINKEHFLNNVENALNARVKVSGGQQNIGQYLNKVLVSGEDEAKARPEEQTHYLEPDVASHIDPPEITRMTKVVMTALAMNVQVATQLAGERWAVPQMP